MKPALRLALFEPDIPQNTAAVLRTCACLGVPAEIIRTHSQLAPSDALQLDGSEQELGLEGGMELAKSSIEDLSGGGIEETLAQFSSGVLPVEEQNA